MAAGISSYCAGKLLEATCKATAFSVTTVYIQPQTIKASGYSLNTFNANAKSRIDFSVQEDDLEILLLV